MADGRLTREQAELMVKLLTQGKRLLLAPPGSTDEQEAAAAVVDTVMDVYEEFNK